MNVLSTFAKACCDTATSRGINISSVIDTGAQNCVLFTDEGSVLRFPRFEPLRVQEVAERHQKITDLGLPAPRIYDVHLGVAGVAHLVIEKVPGLPFLDALPNFDLSARNRATDELVEVLLNARTVDPDSWPFFSHKWIDMWTKLSNELGRTAVAEQISADDVVMTQKAVAAAKEAPLGLIHGDLAWGNILFSENGQLTTVLDWDFAVMADPAIDTSAILLNLPTDMTKRFHQRHRYSTTDMERVQHYLDTWDLQHRLWQSKT